jgi:predicted dehydrogenase
VKPRLRFGIIGSGFVALTHAEALKHVPQAQLVAVAGGRNAAELAAQYGARMESDVEHLLRAEDVEAVVVCSPHFVHAEQAVASLRAGKHVLVEKPMAVTVEECTAMIAAAEAAGRKLMVAHFQRFREPNAAAGRALREGRVGQVLLAQQRLLELPNNKSWQLDGRSRGFFLGYGVHGIDLLRFWIGGEITEVSGFIHHLRGNATEDGAQGLFRFAGGASAALLATDSLPEGKSRKSPGAAGLWSLLIGEKGILEIDSYGETVLEAGGDRQVLGRLPSWSSLTSPERIRAYQEQDQGFVDSILRDTPPPIPGAEGMRNVAAALALYESARTGTVVRLKDGL